jgi:hypothetical protein
MTLPSPLRLLTAPTPRMSVSAVFAVTEFISSTWIARIPAAKRMLDLDTAQLGTLLLFIAAGYWSRASSSAGSSRVTEVPILR